MNMGSSHPSFEPKIEDYTEPELALGRKIFARKCDFALSVVSKSQLQDVHYFPELAFAGRSNVGKSSIINALTQQKLLARASRTPGRTQCLNFFNLDNILTLVDLPGYGYAKASHQARNSWGDVLTFYLQTRPELKKVFLLMDARVPLKKGDHAFMKLCDQFAINFQLVMTKCDCVKPGPLAQKHKALQEMTKKHVACVPWVTQTSSKSGLGLDELRTECVKLALGATQFKKLLNQ